jgi:hypothetical protein
MEPLIVIPKESTSRFYVIFNLENGLFLGHMSQYFANIEIAKRFHLLEEATSVMRRKFPFNHRIFAVKAVYEFTKVG